MEFGKLADIEKMSWEIPATDLLSVRYLQSLPRSDSGTQYLLGAPAWSHKEWVGRIYPEKTKAADYLYHYSRYFGCIELNTSHYRIPTPDQTEKWISQVPEGFLFCGKLPQSISHEQGGLADKLLLQDWLRFLQNLKTNRGPSFLQLPPHFDYNSKAMLFRFLQNWPQEFELTLEFRHPSWFAGGRVLPALVEYLQSRRIGLVITDVAGRRDVLHTSIGADFTFLRFIGNDLHPTDFTRAEAWLARLQEWQNLGLKKIFLMVHEPDDIKTPEMAAFFMRELQFR